MTSNTTDDRRTDLTDQPLAVGCNTYTDGFGRNRGTPLTDGGEDEDEDEWRPSCYDCGREMQRRHLNPTLIHIEHEDDSGYDVVDVPLCHSCLLERLPTHECQTCGREYIHLDRAAECCQNRQERPMPDGGEVLAEPEFDVEALADPVCEFCGNSIETLDKQCPALVNGRCLP